MANILFNTVEQLENYRSDRLIIDMEDVAIKCGILRSILKPAPNGIFRVGSIKPIIKEGDLLTICDKKEMNKAYYLTVPEVNKVTDNVITFEEILENRVDIYNEAMSICIIPSTSTAAKKSILTNKSYINNNLITAILSIISDIVSSYIGDNLLIDRVDKLEEVCSLPLKDKELLRTYAVNFFGEDMLATNTRYEVTEEMIEDKVFSFEEQYDRLLQLVKDEVEMAIGDSIDKFTINDRFCRYHFDIEGTILFLEKGVDFRIYEYEYSRLEKVSHNSEDVMNTLRTDHGNEREVPKFNAVYEIPGWKTM